MAVISSIVVAALCRRSDSILLVEERAEDESAPIWMLPGGRVEPGEPMLAALERELSEETGLRLRELPTVAFLVDIDTDAGRWSAVTFDCAVTGRPTVRDPDHLVLRAEWVEESMALGRLGAVKWYDVAPLADYIGRRVAPGSTYQLRRR